jgi:hypothetical protein
MMRLNDTSGWADGELDAPNDESLAQSGRPQPRDGKLSATDGPFAETKEGLGGSILLDETPEPGRTRGRRRPRHPGRAYQTTCAVCGLRLAAGGSVLFQGEHLVHATCWRAEPEAVPRPAGMTMDVSSRRSVVLPVVVVLTLLLGSTASAVTDRVAGEALEACQLAAQYRLLAPATAQWASMAQSVVEDGAGGTVIVQTFVDAQNRFGALIRNGVTCTVYDGKVREVRLWRP